jgi:hypothetical protein
MSTDSAARTLPLAVAPALYFCAPAHAHAKWFVAHEAAIRWLVNITH